MTYKLSVSRVRPTFTHDAVNAFLLLVFYRTLKQKNSKKYCKIERVE